MSVKYEILKRLVKIIGIKRMWAGKSADEIIEQKKKEKTPRNNDVYTSFSNVCF